MEFQLDSRAAHIKSKILALITISCPARMETVLFHHKTETRVRAPLLDSFLELYTT